MGAYCIAHINRSNLSLPYVPWELYYDTRSLDEVISDDACCVCFDGLGNLYIPDEPAELLHGNLFTDGFTSLIQRACPKSSPISKA